MLPILKKLNENLESSMARSMELFRKDSDYLKKLASEKLENLKIKGEKNQYSLSELKNLDFAIKSRCVKKIVENFKKNVRLDFKHLNLILSMIDNENGAVMLPKNVYLRVDKNILEISKFEEETQKIEFSYLLEKNKVNRSYILTERQLNVIIEVVAKKEYDALLRDNKVEFKNAIDFDKIPDDKEIYFRNRREHDNFSPVNRKVKKSLKKFLNEEKVPLEERNNLVLLSFENVVVWLENFGVSEKFKVNENTKKVMILRFENLTYR